MFQHLLREETIQLGITAGNGEEAIAQLIHGLPAWDLDATKKTEVVRLLIEREKFGTTAIGDGIAMPRCMTSAVTHPVAVLGISRSGVAFPSLDGDPVHMIFMLILPETEEADLEKQRILHSAEAFFRDRFIMERLKIAESPEDAFEVILREGSQLRLQMDRLAAVS